MRVLIDPNVLVSALLSETRPESPPRRVVEAAVAGRYTLLLPNDAIAELERVTSTRPHLRRAIRPQSVVALVGLLEEVGIGLPPLVGPVPARCRDPRDDYLLAQALRGDADALVSGDHDLLAMERTGLPFRILNPRKLLTLLDEGNAG